jgi:hypothetical protein
VKTARFRTGCSVASAVPDHNFTHRPQDFLALTTLMNSSGWDVLYTNRGIMVSQHRVHVGGRGLPSSSYHAGHFLTRPIVMSLTEGKHGIRSWHRTPPRSPGLRREGEYIHEGAFVVIDLVGAVFCAWCIRSCSEPMISLAGPGWLVAFYGSDHSHIRYFLVNTPM